MFDSEHTEYRKSCNTAFTMNKAENERIHDLCAQIALEQDRDRFLRLVTELNRLLSTTDLPAPDDQPGEKKT